METEKLIEGQVYHIQTSNNFWMIGRVSIGNNGDNNGGLRGQALDKIDSVSCFEKNRDWCYKSSDRDYRLATPEEIYWLDQCIEAGKFIQKEHIDFSKIQNNYEIY